MKYKCYVVSNGPQILSKAQRKRFRDHIADRTKIHGSEVQIVCQDDRATYNVGLTFTEDVQDDQLEELKVDFTRILETAHVEFDFQVVPLPTLQ